MSYRSVRNVLFGMFLLLGIIVVMDEVTATTKTYIAGPGRRFSGTGTYPGEAKPNSSQDAGGNVDFECRPNPMSVCATVNPYRIDVFELEFNPGGSGWTSFHIENIPN